VVESSAELGTTSTQVILKITCDRYCCSGFSCRCCSTATWGVSQLRKLYLFVYWKCCFVWYGLTCNWSRVVSRAGPDLRFKFVKVFRVDFGPAYKTCHNIKSSDFFLSWCKFIVLTAVTSVSGVIVTFLQLFLFANTAAFFCSLLGLVSHSFWEGDSVGEVISTWWLWVKISHAILGLKLTNRPLMLAALS